MTPEEIAALFRYKPPTEETIPKFKEITDAAIVFAQTVDRVCPASADRTAAIRLIQEARMTANQSIANGGASYR